MMSLAYPHRKELCNLKKVEQFALIKEKRLLLKKGFGRMKIVVDDTQLKIHTVLKRPLHVLMQTIHDDTHL